MSDAAPELLDLTGEVCPYTFVRAKLRLEELNIGSELHVIVDHAPAADNVPRALTDEGQEIVAVRAEGKSFRIVVVKRSETHLKRKKQNEF